MMRARPVSSFLLFLLRVGACLALSTTLSAAANGPDAAEALIDEGVLRFYPEGELTYVPPEGRRPAVLRFRLLEDGVATQLGEAREATPEPDGSFHLELECHFVGPGTLRLTDPAASGQARSLAEIDVECGHRRRKTTGGSDSPKPLRLQALATTSGNPPVTVGGKLVGSREVYHSDFLETVTLTSPDDTSTIRTSRIVNSTETLADGERCETFEEQCERCGGGSCLNTCCSSGACTTPREYEFCRPAEPPEFQSRMIGLLNWDRRVHHLIESDEPGYSSLTEQTSTVRRSYEMTWFFPALPENARIEELTIRAVPGDRRTVTITKPLEDHSIELVDGASAVEATPRVQEPSFTSPGRYCSETVDTAASLLWSLPGPIEGRQVTVRLAPEPTCLTESTETGECEPDCGQSTRTVVLEASYLSGEFRSSASSGGALELMLEPESPSVYPTTRRRPSDPEALGDSSTALRAMLTGGTAGDSYTVEVEIDRFDAAVSGHLHGMPPSDRWGRLEADSSGGGQSAACTIQADSDGEGVCEVTFQSDEVAGRVALRAEVVDEDATAEAGLDVKVPGLMQVPSSPLYFLDGQVENVHAENHYLTGASVERLQEIAREFHALTGARLSFIDDSLPYGGLFDLNGHWTAATGHNTHREGLDSDISRHWRDSEKQVIKTVYCEDDRSLRKAVMEAGAHLLCESRGRKHVNYPQ